MRTWITATARARLGARSAGRRGGWLVAAGLGLLGCSASVQTAAVEAPAGARPADPTVHPGGPAPLAPPESPPMPASHYARRVALALGGVEVQPSVDPAIAKAADAEVASMRPRVILGPGVDAVLLTPRATRTTRLPDRVRLTAPGFRVDVRSQAPDLFVHRLDVLLGDARDGARLHMNSDDTLVWEQVDAKGHPAFHFVAMVQSGGQVYRCESAPGRRFSHAEVLVMVRACWSLTARSDASDDTVR